MIATRRALVVLVAALLTATLLGAGPAGAQDGGWTIESFDVEIVLDPDDGAFLVIEEITVDFGQLQRRGILRTIPSRSRYDDENDKVIRILQPAVRTSAGTPADLDVSRDALTVTLRIGDPDTYISGRHTYRIMYRVEGELRRFDSHDELYWNVTGNEWPVPIRRATARVIGAPISGGICFTGPVGSTRPCADARGQPGEAEVTFAAHDLAPGHGLTVAVSYEPGTLNVPPPILEPRWTLQRAFVGSRASIPLTVVVALLAFAGVIRLVYRQGRDRVARGGLTVDSHVDGGDDDIVRLPLLNRPAVPVEFRPPGGYRPGELGVLIDERVDRVDVSATIVDLAVRGYLKIHETTERGLLRSTTDWTFERLDPPADDSLLEYEQTLLTALFLTGDKVALSDLKGTFHTDYARVASQMYKNAVTRGWFTRSPRTTRSLWLGIGVVATFASVVLLIGLIEVTTFALAGVPLVLASLTLAVAHRWMPHRTPKGSARFRQTLGFREFIHTAEADRARFAEEENIFIAYLPYAVVFGATEKWASAFASLGEEAAADVGRFYVSDGRTPDLGRLASGMSALSAQAGSGLATAPASSGGSSGFGGGGSSGGGGGGGGGGSW
jgi:uncharacterized membrane protein YgcG